MIISTKRSARVNQAKQSASHPTVEVFQTRLYCYQPSQNIIKHALKITERAGYTIEERKWQHGLAREGNKISGRFFQALDPASPSKAHQEGTAGTHRNGTEDCQSIMTLCSELLAVTTAILRYTEDQ